MSDHTARIIPVAYHITFFGRVQGVGFRFTAQRFAVDLGLSGWVRNAPGGEVELFAEGPEGMVMELVSRLKAHFSVHEVKAGKVPVTGANPSFEIRY